MHASNAKSMQQRQSLCARTRALVRYLQTHQGSGHARHHEGTVGRRNVLQHRASVTIRPYPQRTRLARTRKRAGLRTGQGTGESAAARCRPGAAERRPGPTGSRAGAATRRLPLDTSGPRLRDRSTGAWEPGRARTRGGVRHSTLSYTHPTHTTQLTRANDRHAEHERHAGTHARGANFQVLSRRALLHY
jgi:hypothetical protein